MACIPNPVPEIPELPAGLTIQAPFPSVPALAPGAVPICCNLPVFPVSIPVPTPLPPIAVNPAIMATIEAGIAAARAWRRSLPLDCPRS